MNILIAEDDILSCEIYRTLMETWCFDYDLVNNGRDAVNLVIENKNKYNICLLDIEMPVMNGCEAARLIRTQTNDLPIIAVTGNTNLFYNYSEFGMNACILKPFSYNVLLEKIKELAAVDII